MKNHSDLVMAYIGFYLNKIDEIPEIIGSGSIDRPTKKLIPINQKSKNLNEKSNDQMKPNEQPKLNDQAKSNEQLKLNDQPKPNDQIKYPQK